MNSNSQIISTHCLYL